MSIKSNIKILLTALLIPVGLTAPVFAVNPGDLQQLLETRACQGCNLEGADLHGAHLIGADLRDANLKGAILTGANLEGADLTGANLEGANLTDAFLNSADLTNVNFTRANLADANLIQAEMAGANFMAANLPGTEVKVSRLSMPQLVQVQSFYPELVSQDINRMEASEVPRGRAADLQSPGLVVGLESSYFTWSIGGPSLYEPFRYDPAFLNEMFAPQSLHRGKDAVFTVQPFELTPFNWKNADDSFKGAGQEAQLGF